MKNKYVVWTVCLLSLCMSNGVSAQFVDDFESWPDPDCPSWWTHWDGSPCGGIVKASGAGPSDGEYIGFIGSDPDTIDPVLDLGSKIFDDWGLSFYAFIPSGKEAYMNIQGEVPVGAGQWVVGNIHFNQDLATPGEGFIDNSALGVVNFNFPHDEWFRVIMNWDIFAGISLATWEMKVDGEVVIPMGTAFTDSAGTTATSLGGINFFSVSADNELYLDDINYSNEILGTSDVQNRLFSITPNPVVNAIQITSSEAIEGVRLYSVSGQLISETKNKTTVDVSQLTAGTYFIEVQSLGRTSTQQFIKR